MSNRVLLQAACGWMALSAGLATGAAACAADAATQATGQPATPVLGEVLVTAQKRSENLEKVPVAVSAYTSRQRDLIGIETIQDLTNFTPGLAYSTSLDRAYVRGVGRQTNNLSTDPGVATYADGVYNSSVVAAAGDSLFVDRVEVLRGPQGTLYGRNSVGGAINSISRRPTRDFYAEGRAVIGNYGTHNVEAAVSGPLNDEWRFRLAAYRNEQTRGYYQNVAGGPSEGGRGSSWYIEGQVDANLGEHLDFWAKLSDFGYDSSYRGGNAIGSYDYAYVPPGSLGLGSAYGFTTPGFTEVGSATQNPGLTNIRQFSTNTPERAHLTNDYNAAVHLTWHTPWNADLKYIGGFSTYRYALLTDYDNTSITSYQVPTTTPNPLFCGGLCPALTVYPTVVFGYKEDKTYFSNELNLTSTGQGPLQWILGFYQYHEHYNQPVDIPLPDQAQLATPYNSPANPSRDIYYIDQNMHESSYAGFAQADWSVTSQLKITGGIRYSHDAKSGVEHTRQLCFALLACGFDPTVWGALTQAVDITSVLISPPATTYPGAGVVTLDPATGIYSRNLAASWSAWTGTAGLQWTPTDNAMAYFKYSRGYKSGGFNSGTLSPFPETLPEAIDAYELGSKVTLARRLQLNGALFYYNYFNMQIPLSTQPPSGPVTTIFVNMKQVVSYGAELEAVWRATDNLQLLLSYSYLHATIKSGCCYADAIQPGLGLQGVVGQTVPESPRNKISLNGNYTFHLDAGDLNLSASYIWKDRTYDAIFNRPWYLAPAYSQVDLRASFTDKANRYTIIAFAKNLNNAAGADNVSATLLGAPAPATLAYSQTIGLIPPRTYGVELQYRFR